MDSNATQFVLWITSSTPTACEVFAQTSGADVLLIDAQHGAFGQDEALKLVTACASGKAECAVRVSDDSQAAEICRYIDAGATTIVCPMVNDAQSCESQSIPPRSNKPAITKSPPIGNRSYGPYRHRLLFKDGFTPEKANKKIRAFAMIETKKALDNLEQILSVPYLTGVFVGPNDLGLSLGFQPTSSPGGEVLDAVRRICDAARARNKVAGIFCSDIETAIRMRNEGFRFVVFGSDLGLVVGASNQALQKARL